MAKFNVVVIHEIHRELAVTRLRGFSEKMRDQAPVELTDLKEAWDELGNLEFSFKALGFEVSGSMVTCENKITVIGNLPFAALPFRGAIETQIADKVREAIA